MKSLGGILIMAACAASLLACSAKDKPPARAAGPLPSGTVAEGLVTATATVEKVDLKTRKVTLKGPEGNLITVHADERVKNLPQVHKGDLVTVSYYESVAYQVKRPGQAAPGVAAAAGLATAEPGQKPAGVGTSAVTVTSTITGIDKTNHTVTLLDPDGDSVTIKVRDPAKLDEVKVGDLVEITYSEALAVSVAAAQK